jgi:predicted transcriptional regulator of viral defense system
MKLIDTYTKLKKLNLPVIQTNDAAAYLDINVNHASKLLSRISKTNQIIHIKNGVWVFPDTDALILPSLLTSPFPAYVSLQTALYFHNMISQIPNIIYAVSVGRTKIYKTPIATVSIHHIQPSFYFGHEEKGVDGLLRMASPEKALLDIFYLSQTKTRLFKTLPEVELPKNFKIAFANRMIENITSIRKRTIVQRHFSEFINRINVNRKYENKSLKRAD